MCLDLHFPTFRMYHKVVKPKPGLLGGLLGGVPASSSVPPRTPTIRVEVVYHEVANPECGPR